MWQSLTLYLCPCETQALKLSEANEALQPHVSHFLSTVGAREIQRMRLRQQAAGSCVASSFRSENARRAVSSWRSTSMAAWKAACASLGMLMTWLGRGNPPRASLARVGEQGNRISVDRRATRRSSLVVADVC